MIRSFASFVAAIAMVFAALPGQAAAPAGEFPYIAYVVEPDSFVRSGPGRDHYATAQLPAGYAVEVHRHDGNGWCAIRPPDGSFSLAPIQQLQVVDQRTATVAGEGVAARVGSLLGEDRSAVQVMLERGEPVALVEPPSPTSPWVRIAPPAGEFRWIAARRLSRTPPTESTPLVASGGEWKTPGVVGGAVGGIGRIAPPEPSDDPGMNTGDQFAHLRTAPATTVATAAPMLAGGVRPLWQPQPALAESANSGVVTAGGAGDDFQIIAGSPAAVVQAQYQQPVATNTLAAPPLTTATTVSAPEAASVPIPSAGQPRIRFEGLSAGPLDPRVAELQLRLSQIVVAAPANWQFTSLQQEAAALLAQEQSPECRDQLRDLLDRIATFETVQQRYRNQPGAARLASGAATNDSEVLARVRSDLGAADNGITPTPGAAPRATEALYDAVGTLKPVISRRQNAPQFALIDDHGDVVTFVTASPDVNLQSYVGQRIGVRGSRGFIPEYRRAHVTASRVTTLEETVVK